VHVNKWPQISRDLKTTSHEEVINIQYDVPIFSYIAKCTTRPCADSLGIVASLPTRYTILTRRRLPDRSNSPSLLPLQTSKCKPQSIGKGGGLVASAKLPYIVP